MVDDRSHHKSPDSPATRRRPLTLADLAPDVAAEIVALSPAAPTGIQNRLRHLGFRPGTMVTKLRTAPLGDPALYRLLGYDTCLRRHEAAYIEIAGQP